MLEIGTEELPPKALKGLSEAFESLLCEALTAEQLSPSDSRRFATPRRLAVLFSGVGERQADKETQRLGPAVAAAYDDDGKPSKAALGFARSCGVDLDELSTQTKGGVEKLSYTRSETGKSLQQLLPKIVHDALQRLPIPKRMRWGSSRSEFVRPVHWAIALFGTETLKMTLLDVESSHLTYGHRFHHNQSIPIHEAGDYEQILEDKGGVIPHFHKRREMIRELVTAEGTKIGATTVIDEQLLDEVTGLVEYPVALTGVFDDHFLDVPAEAIVLTMKSHQKCFCLEDDKGTLLPKFVTVSNLVSKDPSQVVAGNERVIRPRLADARFFFETDKTQTLYSRRERLKDIVFQERLGSLFDKSQRIARISCAISPALQADPSHSERAASLSKCDLLTHMVGEFAELQGLMGYYYALHDSEPNEVAVALQEQYKPRYSGDSLPETATGATLAIADKIDTLVGIFSIGQAPTGSKDPFALRRAAIGVLRILVERSIDLDLLTLLATASAGFDTQDKEKLNQQVFEFMLDRFKAWYGEQGVPNEVFQAVFALKPSRPLDFHHRVLAVEQFVKLPEAAALAAANKRVSNLLSKQQGAIPDLVEDRLQEQGDLDLHKALRNKMGEVAPFVGEGDYQSVLLALASLKDPVDRFFDEVMVMCDDRQIRDNRLALLQQLRDLFLQVADISYLHQSS